MTASDDPQSMRFRGWAPSGFFALILAGLGLWAYLPTLERLVGVWGSNPDYSHGYLVPPIALWILLQRDRRSLTPSTLRVDHRGLWLLALAAVSRIASGRLYLPEFDAWSLPIWTAGVVWVCFGWRRLVWAGPSIAFLWFASPLPASIELALGVPLQLVAAGLSGASLRLLGFPAITEGTVIQLGEVPLDVERACSGLRIFYGIAALAVAWIALWRPARARAFFVLAGVVPVAITANVARITLTGVLSQYFPSKAARAINHDYAAMLMIPLAAGLFALLLAACRSVERGVGAWRNGNRGPLVRWLAAGACVVALVGWLESRQRGVALEALEASARRSEAAGDWPGAIESWRRCSLLQEDSPRPLVQMGDLLFKHAGSRAECSQAAFYFQQAWRRDRANEALGLKAARCAAKAGEPRTAARLCHRLLKTSTTPETRREAVLLQADAMLAEAESQQAREAQAPLSDKCVEALRLAVGLPDPAVRHIAPLANALRFERSPPAVEEADRLIAGLAETHKEATSAWLVRHIYLDQSADAEKDPQAAKARRAEASEALARALQLVSDRGNDPFAVEVWLTAALDRWPVDPAAAGAFAERAIAAKPTDHRPYLLLADWRRESGGAEAVREAAEILSRGHAAMQRTELAIVLPLASLLVELGETDRAMGLIEPVAKALPSIPAAQRLEILVAVRLVEAYARERDRGPASAIGRLRPTLQRPDVRAALVGSPRLEAQASLALAQFNSRLGRHDVTLSHCRRAQRLDPGYPGVDRRLAQAALAAGALGDADRAFQRLLAAEPEDTAAMLGWADALIRRTKRRIDGAASRAERLIRRAAELGAPREEIVLRQAELLAALSRRPEAIALLRQATNDAPEAARVWRTLAVLNEQAGDLPAARRAAERYAALRRETLDPVLLLAQLSLQDGRPDEALALLSQFRERAEGQELATAAIVEAELLLRREDVPGARALLDQTAEELPNSLPLHDARARLAITSLDVDGLQRAEEQLRKIEGPQGVLYRSYRAMRLLEQASAVSDARFREAAQLVEGLIEARPQWGEMRFLNGEIARRRGRLAVAAAEYAEAWSLGKQDILLADRLIESLMAMRRYDEVRGLLDGIEELLDQSPKLFDRAAPVLAAGWGLRARRLAERWLEQTPDSPASHLRMGRILSLLAEQAGEPARREDLRRRAIAACQQAVQLAPSDAETWVSAIVFLVRNATDPLAIAEMMEELAVQGGIDPLQRQYVLAQLYEATGRRTRARTHFARAVRLAERASPELLPTVLTRSAEFCASSAPLLSEYYARRALRLAPGSPEPKLAVARSIRHQSDESRLPEALRIIRSLHEDDASAIGDGVRLRARRLHASLLSMTGEPTDLRQAIALMESGLQASAKDRRLLAELYEKDGQVLSAFELRNALATATSAGPRDLRAFLRFWHEGILGGNDPRVTSGFADAAEEAYRRLGETPDQYAAWFALKLDEHAARTPDETLSDDRIRSSVEQALELAELHGASEPLSTRVARLMLALAERDLLAPAMRLVAAPPAGLSTEEALAAASNALIRHGKLPPIGTEPREAFDKLALRAGRGGELELMQTVGDCYLMAAEYPTAIAIYRDILGRSPRRKTTGNNLALALSESPEGMAEAESLLASLLEQDANDTQLLDSLAVIRLKQGRGKEALSLLDTLVNQSAENPVYRLHAAQAAREQGDTQASLAYFRDALAFGVLDVPLSPSDREAVGRLMEAARERWTSPPLVPDAVRVTRR